MIVALLIFMLFSAAIGACAGSYASCAFWRIPRKMSLGGRSMCTYCGEEIPPRYNIPILGFIYLRGMTACCGKPLQARYMVYEICFALLGVVIFYLLGVVWPLIALLIFVAVTAFISWITRRGEKDGDEGSQD